jgi:hypothetical protein
MRPQSPRHHQPTAHRSGAFPGSLAETIRSVSFAGQGFESVTGTTRGTDSAAATLSVESLEYLRIKVARLRQGGVA